MTGNKKGKGKKKSGKGKAGGQAAATTAQPKSNVASATNSASPSASGSEVPSAAASARASTTQSPALTRKREPAAPSNPPATTATAAAAKTAVEPLPTPAPAATKPVEASLPDPPSVKPVEPASSSPVPATPVATPTPAPDASPKDNAPTSLTNGSAAMAVPDSTTRSSTPIFEKSHSTSIVGSAPKKSLLAESLSHSPAMARKPSNPTLSNKSPFLQPALPPPSAFVSGSFGSPPRMGVSMPRSISERPAQSSIGKSLGKSIAGSSQGLVMQRGKSGNAAAIAGSYGTPRSFTPSMRSGRASPSPANYGAISQHGSEHGGEQDEMTNSDVAKLVSEHLVIPDEANDSNIYSSSPSSFVGNTSHNLLGGDATRDIYQWHEKHGGPNHRRRNSEPDIRPAHGPIDGDIPRASDLREPGVFRRHFVQRQAEQEGKSFSNAITRNFLDFLALYGFYGGDVYPEDLDESGDDLLEPDVEQDMGEEQPLVPRSRPPSVATIQGTSEKKAFFMVLKAFVGTGVLFLPKAFANGGLIFSLITLIIIGYLTLHCMLLLVDTSRQLGGSFGDIGEHLYGNNMRQVVLFSIALSQAGFCCAYYIFVAQNLRDFTMIVSDCGAIWPDWVFILIQIVAYIPLSWVRKIKHFSITSLIADVFILAGLAYILYFDVFTISTHGVAKDIVYFNSQSFPLFVGTAMFAFEGICLILPIGESMKRPQNFGKVLSWCTLAIGAIFISVGVMGYLTFGAKVETVVFRNLPKQPHTQFLQFVYTLAIMLSFPLTVYPTIRITEHGLFGLRDGKTSNVVKWQKNMYRTVLIFTLGGVAWLGSDNLDKFVSLVGCFACIPLSFIYPSLFHSHIATSKWVRIKDMALVGFGFAAMAYTTSVTLKEWATGQPDLPVDRCS